MSLDEKPVKKSKKYKPQYLIATEKGIKYIPTGEIWEYPLFIGEKVIHSIGPEPLKVEFLHEGKGYIFIFYDKKLGMVAKARISRRHAVYIIQELISRHGKIPSGGLIDDKLLSEIIGNAQIQVYNR